MSSFFTTHGGWAIPRVDGPNVVAAQPSKTLRPAVPFPLDATATVLLMLPLTSPPRASAVPASVRAHNCAKRIPLPSPCW